MTGKIFIVLLLCMLLLFAADLVLGSVTISIQDLWLILSGNGNNSAQEYIILSLRLPRAIMAILTGIGLSMAGLLMQTLFRNPLAGPFVLGISSGAGLGVALTLMGAGWLGIAVLGNISILMASILGSLVVLVGIILMSYSLKDTMGLLIVGLMVGSLTSAVVGIMAYFSPSEQLQRYVFWSLGSLSGTTWHELLGLTIVIILSALSVIASIKALNALLLGEHYALSLGIEVRNYRWLWIIVTSVLAGGVTALAGPIAFIGLAVPHIARLVMPTVNHKVLLPASALIGSCAMLGCDIISQLPFSNLSIPINAVTSLLGAPVVIWLILHKKSLHF